MKTLTFDTIKRGFALPSMQKGVFASILIVTATVSALFALVTNHQTSQPIEPLQVKASDALVVERLNALQNQLKKLEEAVNKPLPEVNLNGISAQIADFSARLEQLREADSKSLTKAIVNTGATLGEELHSIKAVVTHLDDKKSPVKYLPIKRLPFAVVSIDSIQQVAVASVTYDYKTIPLEKGDALAGWKVVSVDYSKQRIELENAAAERILVTHEHLG